MILIDGALEDDLIAQAHDARLRVEAFPVRPITNHPQVNVCPLLTSRSIAAIKYVLALRRHQASYRENFEAFLEMLGSIRLKDLRIDPKRSDFEFVPAAKTGKAS